MTRGSFRFNEETYQSTETWLSIQSFHVIRPNLLEVRSLSSLVQFKYTMYVSQECLYKVWQKTHMGPRQILKKITQNPDQYKMSRTLTLTETHCFYWNGSLLGRACIYCGNAAVFRWIRSVIANGFAGTYLRHC